MMTLNLVLMMCLCVLAVAHAEPKSSQWGLSQIIGLFAESQEMAMERGTRSLMRHLRFASPKHAEKQAAAATLKASSIANMVASTENAVQRGLRALADSKRTISDLLE